MYTYMTCTYAMEQTQGRALRRAAVSRRAAPYKDAGAKQTNNQSNKLTN